MVVTPESRAFQTVTVIKHPGGFSFAANRGEQAFWYRGDCLSKPSDSAQGTLDLLLLRILALENSM